MPRLAARRRALFRVALLGAYAAGLVGCGGSDTTQLPPPVPTVVLVASVTVSGAPRAAFLVGDSAALIATARSAAGTPLPNRVFVWSSSAPNIASVSSTGQVRALREGVAVITASTAGQSAPAALEIVFGRVVNASGGALRNADSSFFLNMPSGIFSQPTLLTVRLLPDSLGDERVVPGTIYAVGNDSTPFFGFSSLKLRFADGVVPRALAVESMQLHVRTPAGWVPQFRASLDFEKRVVDGSISRGGIFAVRSMPVSRIVITGINAGGGLYSGGTGALTAEVFDSLGFRLPDRRVRWSSGAPSIVSVDSLGRLLAGTVGSATITASADGAAGTTIVTSISSTPSDFTQAAEWTTFQGSFGHSGYVQATIDPARLREIWTSRPLPGAELAQATIGGGKIFLATTNLYFDQQIVALNPADGSKLWTTRFDNINTLNQPTYAAGVLYATSSGINSAYLFSLRETDGLIRYQVPFDGFESTSMAPTIVGNTIATPGGLGGGLYGFDPATGAQKFFRPGTMFGTWTPSVDAGRLYATDRGVQSINASDGTLVSELRDSRFTVTTLAVNGSAHAVGISDGQLFSIYAPNLSLSFVRSGFDGMPVFGNDIYAFAGDRVEALRLSGAPWFSYTLSPQCSLATRSMVLTNNLLFISCANDGGLAGVTVAIDLNTRLAVWTHPVGGMLSLSAQGILYIVKDDRITAISAF